MEDKTKKITSELSAFPPVVSVLGHVDHGKTSLLDAIRKSNIAAREHGGSTQNIGASEIEVVHDGNKRVITFIDTPGHEAFSNMRSQGVNAADIVLLIIASDDGVKPQTKESINIIKASKLPYIVVFTKSDLETAQLDRVKREVLSEGVVLEGLGGEVPYLSVSAKSGKGIQELLDLILLSYDLSDLKKDPNAEMMGVVIESKHDSRRGALTTVVIKSGTLSLKDDLYVQNEIVGKVRALIGPTSQVPKALPGSGVEIFGMNSVIPFGSVIYNKKRDIHPAKVEQQLSQSPKMDLDFLYGEEGEVLSVVLKTETAGEMEAILASLPENIKVVYSGQGEISVSDVLLAKDFRAIVIGFHVAMAKEAERIAEAEKIFNKTYNVVYELFDEIKDVADMMEQGGKMKVIGKMGILALFEGTVGKIIGGKVLEGRIAIKDKVKVVRGDEEIAESVIVTLKHEKKDVKEAGRETECGLMLRDNVDIRVGDVLLSYK